MTMRAAMQLVGVTLLIGVSCTQDSQDRTAAWPSYGATPAESEPVVVADGLNGPMGVLVEPDGTIWIVDSGVGGDETVETADPVSREVVEALFGVTSRVIRIDTSGARTIVAHLPSLLVGGIAFGGARLAMLNSVLYATSGGWIEGNADRPGVHSGVVRVDRDRVTEIANTRDLEARQNPDNGKLETNPFGLAVGPDSMLWMTDAAGNTLYRIDPDERKLQLMAVFDAIQGPTPNPARNGAMDIEPVPTGIAFMDGEAYVSLLPGLPMEEGSAKVVHVSQDGAVADYATGLSRLTDLQLGPDGNLYAVSMGFPDETGPKGAIIRIGPGTTSETVVSGLTFPTAIAFGGDGNAYVTTNGVGEPGSGKLLRYFGLARAGSGIARPVTSSAASRN